MDKKEYIKNLIETDLRPKFKKPLIKKTQVPLVETQIKNSEKQKVLNELFVQVDHIVSMAPGKERDLQLLRLSIIAELDAANLYEKLAELAEDTSVRKVLLDVAREEKVHVGEFQSLLEQLDLEYSDAIDEGEGEVEDINRR